MPQNNTTATAASHPNSTPEQRDRYRRSHTQARLRSLQLALVDILREVARLCERHNIPYWLDSGTLLGAVPVSYTHLRAHET